MAEAKDESGFDESKASVQMDLQSRTIAALGIDTMKNLSSLTVLIIGLKGVGVETAKNLILAGPKNVTIYDENIVQIADLGANFFLKESDVGKKTRAEASLASLAELNPFVRVERRAKDLPNDFIQSFGAVVITDTLSKREIVRINKLCRIRETNGQATPSAFILAVTHGVSSHFFSDFGDVHVVTDSDGEPARSIAIEEFEPDGTVTVASKKHGFDDGDEIKFDDLEGETPKQGQQNLSVLNGIDGIKVKRIYYKYTVKKKDPKTGKETEEIRERQVFNQFEIDVSGCKNKIDLDKLSPRKQGGVVNEVKAKKILKFRNFEEALDSPAGEDPFQQFFGPLHPEQGAWQAGAGKTLHLCYASVLQFQQKNERFPQLHSEDDANLFLKIFRDLNEANKEKDGAVFVDNVDEKRVKAYAWYFTIELTGYCSFLGGIAAQEVIKKFGKYTPICQWLHSDHVQFLGNQIPSDAIPQKCRYDHQISLFGKAFQKKIASQKIFLVGTGALGCEYLKGLALMGVGTGDGGKVWCTDMDRIEVSNLSRQFLFRAKHVSKPKSITAASVAKEMNPAFNVEPLEMKVWSETENFFDDKFWDELDICWNALDNVQARKYTDSKCLFHSKPLLESGTQGTKCNSEVIIPYKTKSYNDGDEQETEGIPMCTLQNFPYIIEHCIEFARSEFSGLFESAPKTFNTFVSDPGKFFDQVETAGGEERLAMLKIVKTIANIQLKGKPTFQDCIRIAFDNFVNQHITRIKNLIYWFPEDDVVKEGDKVIGKFWSGHKRFPAVPKFDLNNEDILEYLRCTSNLYAFSFGLEYVRDPKAFKAEAQKAGLKEPKWSPPKGNKVKVDEDDDDKKNGDSAPDEEREKEVNALIAELKKINNKKLKAIVEADFEKDDDKNFHIDFITSCANTRAHNYRIKPASRHKIKIIAGKIIAALATTTAMITGLVELEFYKLLLGQGYIQEDGFYNANINLAVSQFQFFQPDAAIRRVKETRYDAVMCADEQLIPYPDQWTTWDKLVINEGNLSVQELVDVFPKLFWGVKPKLLFKQGKMDKGQLLYNSDMKPRKPNPMDVKLSKDASKSEKIRKDAQKRIDALEKQNENLKKGLNKKVIDYYIDLYGKLISEKRRYIVLDGEYEDTDGNVAILPQLQYFF